MRRPITDLGLHGLLTIGLLTFGAGDAQAITRVEADSQTCTALQTLVQREGAAIIRRPSPNIAGLTLYDRYVAGQRQCARGEVVQSVTIPTSDTNICRLKVCEPVRDDRCDEDELFRPLEC